MNSLYILWLRQIKKYLRSKARIIGSLGQPLLFLLALGFGLGHVYSQAGGGSYIQFLIPGVIAMSVLFTAMFSGIEVIWDRQFGFLKETLVAPISRLTIMTGRTFGGATVSALQGIIVLAISFLTGFRPHNLLMLPVALLFMLLIGLCFTAFGTAIASRMEDMQAFPLIMNFIIMPLFFLSGALFPIEGAPKFLAIIAQINPLSYGIDGIRGALTGMSHFGLFTDFFVLGAITAVFFVLGSYLFSKIQL